MLEGKIVFGDRAHQRQVILERTDPIGAVMIAGLGRNADAQVHAVADHGLAEITEVDLGFIARRTEVVRYLTGGMDRRTKQLTIRLDRRE